MTRAACSSGSTAFATRQMAAQGATPGDTSGLEFMRPLTDLMPFWPDMPDGAGFVAGVGLPQGAGAADDGHARFDPPDRHRESSGASPDTYQGTTGRFLYVAGPQGRSSTGRRSANAVRRIGLDSTRPNASGVSLTMNAEGARRLPSRHRAERRPLARDRARRQGRLGAGHPGADPQRPRLDHRLASPTRRRSDLAIVLQAGALPAPVNIIQEMTVGPSLGADSIRTGTSAVLIGALDRRALHAHLLPAQRAGRGHRALLQHALPHRGAGRDARHAHAARHRRHGADRRHGGRRQRADLRAHSRGDARRQEGAAARSTPASTARSGPSSTRTSRPSSARACSGGSPAGRSRASPRRSSSASWRTCTRRCWSRG